MLLVLHPFSGRTLCRTTSGNAYVAHCSISVQLSHVLGDGVLVAFRPRFLLGFLGDAPSFTEVFGVTF